MSVCYRTHTQTVGVSRRRAATSASPL